MSWFKRTDAGIRTTKSEQNDVPEGQWAKDPETGEIINARVLQENALVFPNSGHHLSMSAREYFDLLFDDSVYELYDTELSAVDALDFVDRKSYAGRIAAAQNKTGLSDAASGAMGNVGGHRMSIAAMDFSFIGGSMGSVVGEVISRAIKRAYTERVPLLVISQSGGARMMEGALSLMQMAKTSAHLAQLHETGMPYISLLTDPTTGGVTASFAMLGDFNIAEPGALIGFAGPRVIRESIGQELPKGFQRAEFLKEHGFIDFIVDRRHLRARLIQLLDLILEKKPAA
ncbi:MAG: acetyl-CoA carboxylase, carboxyltransferase subunit beta [Rhodothermales bacterium]